MNISRYQPWTSPNGLQQEMKQVFDRFFEDSEGDQSNVVTSQWAPRVDIKEDESRFAIFVDVPGVDPASIDVHMEQGILSIKGERKVEAIEGKGKYTRVERSHGTFYRRFALPDSADPENVSATGRHGVLEIVIPKRAETKPRKIDIRTT